MFGQRIKELRSGKELTQSEFATLLGIAKTTLAAYEQEKNEPNIAMLTKMASFFDVTVDYLVGKTNCSNSDYQPFADSLGIDEKTIDILKSLGGDPNDYTELDFLEAIMQHPHFPTLMGQINTYFFFTTTNTDDACLTYSDGSTEKTFSIKVLIESQMQLIQATFRGIVEGIPYSKHFLNKK